MKCKVLFFAAAAQAMECREKEIQIASSATVGDVFDSFASTCAPLASLSTSCAFAVDGQLARRDLPLREGCTVAILPPVSGG